MQVDSSFKLIDNGAEKVTEKEAADPGEGHRWGGYSVAIPGQTDYGKTASGDERNDG
jgi:hypothetical protein